MGGGENSVRCTEGGPRMIEAKSAWIRLHNVIGEAQGFL